MICPSKLGNYPGLSHTIESNCPALFGADDLCITRGSHGAYVHVTIKIQQGHDEILKMRMGDIVVNEAIFET